jgi:hypothetical protein
MIYAGPLRPRRCSSTAVYDQNRVVKSIDSIHTIPFLDVVPRDCKQSKQSNLKCLRDAQAIMLSLSRHFGSTPYP